MSLSAPDGYIDMHTHILHCVDDGAKDIEIARQMLKKARSENIKTIVATPHYRKEKPSASYDTIGRRLEELRQVAAELDPAMQILVGNELFYSESTVDALIAGECRTLNGTSYVLVEFYPSQSRSTIRKALYRLLSEGFYPVLAHVERYDDLQKDMAELQGLLQMGVYFQMNASSLLGKLGMQKARYAKKLLKNGMIHAIATDCHDTQSRPPEVAKCARYIAKKYGEEYANRLLHENPLKILQNDYIEGAI